MKICAISLVLLATSALAKAQFTGPSTKENPYYLPKQANVRVTSLLTVGEGPNGYRLVGIPDGMGLFKNKKNQIELLINHELGATQGIQRAHGFAGAFISRWTIDPKSLSIISGEDLIKRILPGNHGTGPFGRFCSSDLAANLAYYDSKSGKGTKERIYLTGEEVEIVGRAVGTIVTGSNAGTSAILPALGKMSYENVVTHPRTGEQTIVACMDDSRGGQVYFYKGKKSDQGNEFQKAGLTNGIVYGLAIKDFPKETPETGQQATPFSLVDMGENTNASGKLLEGLSNQRGVTQFARPEDFHWHPTKPNIAYWTTTGMTGLGSKLWRITFKDMSKIEAGGTIEAVLTTNDGIQSLDNLTVDANGNVLVQEDPGTSDHLAKIWHYNPNSKFLRVIAEADPERFSPNGSKFVTTNEESSGIIDVSEYFGPGMYLFNVQVHNPIEGELVQGGQLLALYVPQ